MKYIDACWSQLDVYHLYRYEIGKARRSMNYTLAIDKAAECYQLRNWSKQDIIPILYCADQALLEKLGCLDSGLL